MTPIAPFLGLAATPAVLWAFASLAAHTRRRHHARRDAWELEMREIDVWLDAIRRTPAAQNEAWQD